jgi:hypothetical protein
MATVNWTFVALMAVLAFVAALLGSLIAFRSRFSGRHHRRDILFAVGFVAWNYYPHNFGLPIIIVHRAGWHPRRPLVDLCAAPLCVVDI